MSMINELTREEILMVEQGRIFFRPCPAMQLSAPTECNS